MTIDLSGLHFTNNADIVPSLGADELTNSGFANTLKGNERLTGVSSNPGTTPPAFYNEGSLLTGLGHDYITAKGVGRGLTNYGVIDTGPGEDKINVISSNPTWTTLFNQGTIIMGHGHDLISAKGDGYSGIRNRGVISIGEGNDVIDSSGDAYGIFNDGGNIETEKGNDSIIVEGVERGLWNYGLVDTGQGNDKIKVISSNPIRTTFFNRGIVISGHGNDVISAKGGYAGIRNAGGTVDTGKGNDLIDARGESFGIFNEEGGGIHTGYGNDILTGVSELNAAIYNRGADSEIFTGQGRDRIIGSSRDSFGILNEGNIDTGRGNDLVDARKGGFWGNGDLYLDSGNDKLRGFGSGNFHGGHGRDLLELTEGQYTVGISGHKVSFINSDGITMDTFQFERLLAGSNRFNFNNLFDGQEINVF
ncbi:MAG: hypothetical protein AB4050_08740 [Synechococcus sp.]